MLCLATREGTHHIAPHAMIHQFLAFASDAKLLVASGLLCWVVAAVALVAERRRHARTNLDQVGWVPWTGVFLAMLVCGTMFVLLGAKALLPA